MIIKEIIDKEKYTISEFNTGTVVQLYSEDFNENVQDHTPLCVDYYMILNSKTCYDDEMYIALTDLRGGNIFYVNYWVIPRKVMSTIVKMEEI